MSKNHENTANVREIGEIVGLQFRQPTKEEISELTDTLFLAAEELKADFEFPHSHNGILVDAPTESQRKMLGDMLNVPYGNYFMNLQDGLRPINIQEAGDRMVNLQTVLPENGVKTSFSQAPINEFGGEWAGKPKVFWVRERVAEKLIKAGSAYNKIGLVPHFEDAFRPYGVQEGLFQTVVNRIVSEKGNISDGQLLAEARSMVAISPWISGHKAGASVDMTLKSIEGNSLDLGHPYLALGAQVAIDYPFVTWEQYRTRQIFAKVSEMAELTVYPGEDWHVSWGDNSADIMRPIEEKNNLVTQYGPIKSFDSKSGEIEPYAPAEYYQPYSYTRSLH